MKARTTAVLLAIATVAYIAIAGYQAVLLIGSGSIPAIVFGIGLVILPIIGLLLVWREVRFGMHVETMTKNMSEADLSVLASVSAGGLDDADSAFETEKARTQEDPTDWRAWYRLAATYDVAKDRKRARAAMRYAYELYSQEA